MKIILSRKGFDSSIQGGGNANIVYNDELFPIPIPEVGNNIKYTELVFENDITYLDVMRDLNINQFTECHFDPYLSKKLLKNDSPIQNWKKSLGQCDIAQNILKTADIKKGDLFIFFGWFNKVEKENGKFKYTNFKNHTKEGVQLIYGYLQVGDEIINIEKNDKVRNDWVSTHPHFKQRRYYRGENMVYTANDILTVNKNKPGAGIFKFNEDLILTQEGKSRTNWVLPEVFHPSNDVEIKYLPKQNWSEIKNKKTKIKASSRGQEFVVVKDSNEKIKEWAINLINSHKVE